MPTPHIESSKEDIAKKIIMPGDPLRAKFIAETFLDNAKEVNSVRNCLAYTGEYKGERVTVFASGMGIPSMGIYAHELYSFYDVETIIRVGSCGSYKRELNVFDLVLVEGSCSESTFDRQYQNLDIECINSNKEVTDHIEKTALKLNKEIKRGNVFCSEAFYTETSNKSPLITKYDCLGVEMETFALFNIAQKLNKKAACILTVSDSLVTSEEISSEQRETGFKNMLELALEAMITFDK